MLLLVAFLGGFGGKSAKNVECVRGRKYIRSHNMLLNLNIYFCIETYKQPIYRL